MKIKTERGSRSNVCKKVLQLGFSWLIYSLVFAFLINSIMCVRGDNQTYHSRFVFYLRNQLSLSDLIQHGPWIDPVFLQIRNESRQ